MEIKYVVAKRIRLFRVERDWTQVDLAEAIGKDQTYVSKVESGEVNIQINTLDQIARALNKPIEHFFKAFEGEAGEMSSSVDTANRAVRPPLRKAKRSTGRRSR